jgi:hypothetical protein
MNLASSCLASEAEPVLRGGGGVRPGGAQTDRNGVLESVLDAIFDVLVFSHSGIRYRHPERSGCYSYPAIIADFLRMG